MRLSLRVSLTFVSVWSSFKNHSVRNYSVEYIPVETIKGGWLRNAKWKEVKTEVPNGQYDGLKISDFWWVKPKASPEVLKRHLLCICTQVQRYCKVCDQVLCPLPCCSVESSRGWIN